MSNSSLTKTPRVDALIDRMMELYFGVSTDAQIRYYENVHQELAPLSRDLEIELAAMTKERDEWKAKAEFWESKATKNKQDADRYQWLRETEEIDDATEARIDAARSAEKKTLPTAADVRGIYAEKEKE